MVFYLNHGRRCAQTAIKNASSLSGSRKVAPYKVLDALVGYSPEFIVYPSQIAYALKMLEFNFDYFVKPGFMDLASLKTLESSIRREYGQNSGRILNATNLPKLLESIAGVSQIASEVQDKPSLNQIRAAIHIGKIPICLVNYDILVGRENLCRGHYLVVKQITADEVVCIDSGPMDANENRKIKREDFLRAWSLSFMDHDIILLKPGHNKDYILSKQTNPIG